MAHSIAISDVAIHQDNEGRYSLNDLHKAAGGEQRHQPRYWLALDQTNELIEEILNSGISLFVSSPTYVKKGRYGGTYVCKELVYSYAMWISAAFSLKVIRTFDALVSGNIEQVNKIAKTTTDERTPLRDAINMLVGKKGLLYPEAYSLIHQRFNVSHIDELEQSQLPVAIEYVHRLALEGELLERESHSSEPSDREMLAYNVETLAIHYTEIRTLWREQVYPALKSLESPLAGRLNERFIDGNMLLMNAKRSVERQLRKGEVARIL